MHNKDHSVRLESKTAEMGSSDSGAERVTKMTGAGAESERPLFFRSDNSSIFSFARSVNEYYTHCCWEKHYPTRNAPHMIFTEMIFI